MAAIVTKASCGNSLSEDVRNPSYGWSCGLAAADEDHWRLVSALAIDDCSMKSWRPNLWVVTCKQGMRMHLCTIYVFMQHACMHHMHMNDDVDACAINDLYVSARRQTDNAAAWRTCWVPVWLPIERGETRCCRPVVIGMYVRWLARCIWSVSPSEDFFLNQEEN